MKATITKRGKFVAEGIRKRVSTLTAYIGEKIKRKK